MKYETQNTGIENMRYDFMPVGSIVPFASDIIPLGWLLCDGAPIERNRYPELYDLIGDKLPDHRGMFLRGNDNGRGIDAGRVLGSGQGDAIRNITGDLSVRIGNVLNHDILMPDEMAFYTKKKGSFGGSASRVVSLPESPLSELSILTMDVSRVVPTAEENRPKNNSVNYIIKALHIANPSMEYQVADGLNHKIETNRNTIDFNLLATLGISYGGILNNTSPKLAGVAYYDEIARKLFKCIEDTSIDYADVEFFEAISNNDLLGRLNKLSAKFSDTYTGTISGITFELRISKVGNCCTFNFNCWGTNEANDPILFTLPSRYFPAHAVRVAGYPIRENTDVIINTNGVVMLSGSIGENKNNIEVGCGYMTFN